MRASAWGPAALVYTILAAVLGRDVLARLGTAIANDPGDPLLTAAILHWNATHLPWSEAWWQFPIYYPTRDALAFSEHLLGLSVIASPIAWITGNPLASYNLTLLLTFPLCAMAMFALVYYLTRSVPAAFLAGLAYGFTPYRVSNLPHIQMLASFWAPLALLGLHAFLDSGKRRWLVVFGAGWALQAAANWYSLILFSVLVGLWVAWFVILQRRWRALGAIAVSTFVAAIPLLPIVYKYLSVHAHHGFVRSVGEMREYSADVAAVLCAPSNLTFWGWVRVACRGEGELFPGVALFALFVLALVMTLRASRGDGATATVSRSSRTIAVITRLLLGVAAVYALIVAVVLIAGPWRIEAGFIRLSASDIDKPLLVALTAGVAALLLSLAAHAARRPASAMAFYLFAAVVTWLLALGPTVTLMGEQSGRPGPFVLIQALPGVAGLRVPARFWLMTGICLATVAGLVTASLLRRANARTMAGATVIGGLALLADSWTGGIPAQPPPAPVPDARLLQNGLVLTLPIEPFPDIASTWRAATGGWTSVNGYSGYAPNYYTALSLAAKSGDAAMFTPFQRERDLHVIVPDDAPALKAVVAGQPGAVMTARGQGSTQYRLPRRTEGLPPRVGTALPVVASRSDCASETVRLAFDDDETSKWDCLKAPESHWLTVDVGRSLPVAAVAYSVGSYGWNVPGALAIETSVDGTVWEMARQGSILAELIDGGLADPARLRAVLPFTPREARYVRVRPVGQQPDFGWFVAELDVLSAP